MFNTLSSLIFLLLSLVLVIKSSDVAIRYCARLAESFRLPAYLIGFFIVAVISILPETFIAVTSALQGVPAFGLGTLFGSNVADLTLVFALVVLISGRSLRVQSTIINNRSLYIGMLSIPILFGLNGYYSQTEGLTLVFLGALFYVYIFKHGRREIHHHIKRLSPYTTLMLLSSMAGLVIGAHLTVVFGVQFAGALAVNPILIGMFVAGLGTTLPELLFSIRAAKKGEDGLALGDVLGTVIADATIVVGIMAAIRPFSFQPRIIYITGVCMLFAAALVFFFMKSGKRLTKHEVFLLLLFYVVFMTAELFIGGV